MTIVSKRSRDRIRQVYHSEFGLTPWFFEASGLLLDGAAPLAGNAGFQELRERALAEAVRWGEPYVFALAPRVLGWVVPLVAGRAIRGGLLGGGVRLDPAADAAYVEQNLVPFESRGVAPATAREYLLGLPHFPKPRVREAAETLHALFYRVSGWDPVLLRENKARSNRRREIQGEIEQQRRAGGGQSYPADKERVLLSLIKAGDRNGARSVLNEMLCAMFVHSPKLVILRARAIELLGYLTRAAIEDSPLMASLLERNHGWTERLIGAPDFASLCDFLTRALDEFMEGIYLHGTNRSNQKVADALDFITKRYQEKITLAAVADHVGLSPHRIAHVVKENTGKSIMQIVREVRIEQAKRLLDRTSRTCTEIAYEVGYNDQSYFIKHFKRREGITPAQYRRRYIFRAGAN